MSQNRNTTTGKKRVITELPYNILIVKHSAQKSNRGTNLKNPSYHSKNIPVIKVRSNRISKGGKSKKVLKKKEIKQRKENIKNNYLVNN